MAAIAQADAEGGEGEDREEAIGLRQRAVTGAARRREGPQAEQMGFMREWWVIH